MTTKLSELIANVNDFDGVFYNPLHIKSYDSHFSRNFAKTLVTILPDEISYDEAFKLAEEGYQTYGDSVTALMEWAYKRGINGQDLREKFFPLYHKNLFSHFVTVAPHVFNARSPLAETFSLTKGTVRNGIATHGCAENFTRPLLPSMHLAAYVEEDAIFGLADSGYLKKSTHTDLVAKCLDALGATESESAYTEDTANNLRIHKEMMPQLTTIFINNGRPLERKPSFIDYEFESFQDYLTALYVAHSEPRKLILT